MALAPQTPLYHYNLGGAYYQQEQYSAAAGEYEAALNAAPADDPDRWQYALALGQTQMSLSDAATAAKAPENAVALAPQEPEPLAWLALAYRATGDKRACATMQKAVTLAQNSASSTARDLLPTYQKALSTWGGP